MKDAAVKAEREETLGPNHAVWLEKQTNTALSAAFPLASVEQAGTDHERIWLQNAEDAKHQDTGRMWCEDKVWPDDPEDGEPTEYVRADLVEQAGRSSAEPVAVERFRLDRDREMLVLDAKGPFVRYADYERLSAPSGEQSLREALEPLLREMAKQKLICEMTVAEYDDADFDGAWDTIVAKAREAATLFKGEPGK